MKKILQSILVQSSCAIGLVFSISPLFLTLGWSQCLEGICLLAQLLAVSLSHLHHIDTVFPFSQSACSFTSLFTSSNSTGYAANMDTHLNADISIFFWIRLQIHIHLVYGMEIPASTAAAVNKLTTALNKQLPFIEAVF